MLKAILFDLDDTLLDWSGFHGDWAQFERPLLQGVYDLTAARAGRAPEWDAFVTAYRDFTSEGWRRGRGTLAAPHLGRILLETAQAHGVPAGALTVEECLAAYPWGAVPGCRPFPEAAAVLEQLIAAGLKLAIVTNAHQPMALRDVEMQQQGLLHYFPDCRISAADAGLLKPHPSIFYKALHTFGLRPEEAVFVGDNPVADIAGAQGVGMRAVLRRVHHQPPMLSGLIVPDAALDSLDELPAILDGWYPGWRA